MQQQNNHNNNQNNPRLSFDQKPIGGGQKIPQLSQYPPDFNPNQIQIENKPEPLLKRLQSKVWKIRKQALQQLQEQCKQNTNVYQQYQALTIKLITDANHMCQQRALKILLYYLQQTTKKQQETILTIQPKTIIKSLIEKCLVLQKGQIVPISTEIMFWMMDHHKNIMMNQVSQALLNKNPKIVSSTLSFIQKLVHNYGVKKLDNLQFIMKNLVLLGQSVRPIAKKQFISFFKQVYRWMGEHTFTNFRIHPQVKQQIVKFSKNHTKQPMLITRGLDQQQKKGKKSCVQNNDEQQNQQPQDILISYDSRWIDKVLQISKWKQKKSILDQFIKKINVNNIVPRQSTHFITLIKRLLMENNINLLQCGFKIVKNLCRGLKKNFIHPCKVFQSLAFNKLKDSKAMIVDQTQQTLQAMLYSISIQDFIEDIKQGLKDKAPNMRLQTLKFIEKTLQNQKNNDKRLASTMKILTSIFVDLNTDGASQVRDKTIDVLCKIKGKYGVNFFGDKLKKLPQKKLMAIQNYIDPNAVTNNNNNTNIMTQQMDIQNRSEQPQPQNYIPPNNNINISKTKSLQSSKMRQVSHQTNKNNININNNKSSLISQPQKCNISQYQIPNQSLRYSAYQSLLQKPPQYIYSQLVIGYKNKVPMYRQSSVNILKCILSLIKKSIGSNNSNTNNNTNNTLSVEHMQVIMYHDWKKCKNILMDFIQNNKLSIAALQYVKNSGVIYNNSNNNNDKNNTTNNINYNTSNNNNNNNNNPTLKQFYLTIQNLLPKLSSPDLSARKQAAIRILQILREVPNIISNNSNQTQQPECMMQFYNVLKCRIQDNNNNMNNMNNNNNSNYYQVANKNIEIVTQLLNKGFLTTTLSSTNNNNSNNRTPITRQLISLLLQKLNDPKLFTIQIFIKQMIHTHPTLLFQLLPTQLIKQPLCDSILSIIRYYNQSFFKYADQKVYILPLLTCMSMKLQMVKCMELLDQIVQINGQSMLEKIIKDCKFSGNQNVQGYLRKWNVSAYVGKNSVGSINGNNNKSSQLLLNNPLPLSINNNTKIPTIVSMNKKQRLSLQNQSPWPLEPSPSHILKLISNFLTLGQPFTTIASPLSLTKSELQLINSFDINFLQNCSDLLIKWIYWRIHIQYQPKNVMAILNLASNIVNIGFQLQQTQMIVLLGALSACLTMHKMLYVKQVENINILLGKNGNKEKIFRFWINLLNNNDNSNNDNNNSNSNNNNNNSNNNVDQILYLMMNCFDDQIATQMVTLARLPYLLKNPQFIKYLKHKFSDKLLTVYGFKFHNNHPKQNNYQPHKLYSKQIIPITFLQCEQNNSRYFFEFFRRSSSNQITQKIVQYMSGIPQQIIMDTHLKIMWSIITPYLNRQLPFINVYNYFKYLQKIITMVNISPYLLSLVKTICYFLIDIDQSRLQNKQEMMKTINKVMLLLLEIKDMKHIIQVLFLFYRQQLQMKENNKLNLLLPKCISKIIKNSVFKMQVEHNNPEYLNILGYVVQQTLSLINQFQQDPTQTPITKTIRTLLNDLIILYGKLTTPMFLNLCDKIIKNQHGKNLLMSMVGQKQKQNVYICVQDQEQQVNHNNNNSNNNNNSGKSNNIKKTNSNGNNGFQFGSNTKSVANIIRAVGVATQAAQSGMNQLTNQLTGRKSLISQSQNNQNNKMDRQQ